jgi:plasmid stabilization system protein ParE
MEKAKSIVVRKSVGRNIVKTLTYLEEEGYLQGAINLADQLEEAFTKLSKYPTIGKPSQKKPNVRSWIVGKRWKLFYTEKKDTIVILDFTHMRQDPSKNKY